MITCFGMVLKTSKEIAVMAENSLRHLILPSMDFSMRSMARSMPGISPMNIENMVKWWLDPSLLRYSGRKFVTPQ